MVRRLAALLLFAPLLLADPVIVPIVAAEWVPVAADSIVWDGAQFYSFDGRDMARLTREGELLDADARPLTTEWVSGTAAGAGVIVTLRGTDSYGASGWSPEGKLLWTRDDLPNGKLSFDGTAFVIVRTVSNEGIFVTRFDPGGRTLETRTLRRDPAAWRFVVVPAGDGWLLVWVEYENDTLVAQFVDRDGAESASRIVTKDIRGISSLAAASNGTDAVVLWSKRDGQLVGLRFDRQRRLSGPGTLGYDAISSSLSLVWDGRIYRAIWATPEGRVEVRDLGRGIDTASRATFDWRKGRENDCTTTLAYANGGQAVLSACGFGVFLDAGEPVAEAEERAVFKRRVTLIPFATAWTGDRYVVAWNRSKAPGSNDIYARFFAEDGTPLGEPFVVARDDGYQGAYLAAAAGGAIVAWSGDTNTPARARRFDLDGNMIDVTPFDIPWGNVPDVASNGFAWGNVPEVGSDGSGFAIATTRGCEMELREIPARGPLNGLTGRPMARLKLCERPEGEIVWLESPVRLRWDGSAYAVLYNRGRVTGPEWHLFTPFLCRVFRDGSATPSIQLGNEHRGAWKLAAGKDAYVVGVPYHAPLLVPHDLSTARPLDVATVSFTPDVLWTGSSYFLLYGSEYAVVSPAGRLLEKARIGGQREIAYTGAGNDCGGALVVLGETPLPTELSGRVFPCTTPRRRPVRN